MNVMIRGRPHLGLRVGKVARGELLQGRRRRPVLQQQRGEPGAEEVAAGRELAVPEELGQEHVVEGQPGGPGAADGGGRCRRGGELGERRRLLLLLLLRRRRRQWRRWRRAVVAREHRSSSLQRRRRRGRVHGAEAARVAGARGGDRGRGGRGRRLHG